MEIVRFCLVGFFATVLQYGIYLVLKCWIDVTLAYAIGYILSFLANFWLSNAFTFKTKPNVKKGVGFLVSHGINFMLHMVLLNVFIRLGVPDSLAPIPVFCIVIPINFLLVRTALKKL